MAEALLRHIDSRNFEAFSAGTIGQQVHPLSIEVIKEVGIDLGQKTPRVVDEFRNELFDFVITLDEATAMQNTVTAVETVHWKFDNPLGVSNDPMMQRRSFRTVRDQIAQRLRLFAIVHVRPGIQAQRTSLAQGSTPLTSVH